jgi:hypothetical protein
MYFLAFSQIAVLDHFEWSLSVFWITLSMARHPRARGGIINTQRQEIAEMERIIDRC